MTKRLYRSAREKMLGGVAGGLADYFEVDVTLVRLIWLVLLLSGFGVIAYVVAWVLIPINPEHRGMPHAADLHGTEYQNPVAKYEVVPVNDEERAKNKARNQKFVGIALITIGGIYILNQILPWFRLAKMWPLLFVLIGVVILLRGNDGGKPQ